MLFLLFVRLVVLLDKHFFFIDLTVLDDTQNLGIDPRHLQPLLNEAEGFYQIGPKLKCKEHFVLSVTIAQAANLTQV